MSVLSSPAIADDTTGCRAADGTDNSGLRVSANNSSNQRTHARPEGDFGATVARRCLDAIDFRVYDLRTNGVSAAAEGERSDADRDSGVVTTNRGDLADCRRT